MIRLPVTKRKIFHAPGFRFNSSSSFIRNSFIEYFVKNHGHKQVKSSSVVPLYDPTVPFVNAGMNQFKGVLLGKVVPPYARVVNSQKCVRVGGKHNDLDVVGTDGYHHTFFEMLGSWSFGDYYKKEACKMAWDLLLGPYRLKPENLVVTYFQGCAAIGLVEDKECRDIWKAIGVPESRLKSLGAKENFWEMGVSGPCGPCTEIHYINPDGSLTEIWNLVFINFIREEDGRVKGMGRSNIDTGMGLERMAKILQGVPSNYDTDLFKPIITAIEKNSKGVASYGGSFDNSSELDCAYRRLADHARMISVCLADGVFPASSLNLKQIMRKSFKISTDVFRNPRLLSILYNQVAETLGSTYPELVAKEAEAKLIIEHEEQAYAKMKAGLTKKMKELVQKYPEVEALNDVELPSFTLGYSEFKDAMSKHPTNLIPGQLVFKLYDTHGFQEDLLKRIADLNKMKIDQKGFWELLTKHKSRHKTAYKEQINNKSYQFAQNIAVLKEKGYKSTNDSPKYEYELINNQVEFKPLKTKLIGILNEDLTFIDMLDPCENRPYYLVTQDTNFYCEEGGQSADDGMIYINDNVALQVDSVFKIQGFVFHKGYFAIGRGTRFVKCNNVVELEMNTERRLKLMKNHTAVHLLNAAMKRVLPNSVVCPIGSSVTENGLSLSLVVYGEKLSHGKILEAQNLIRKSIQSNAPVTTRIVDSVELSKEDSVVTIPGEIYPEVGLRLVTAGSPLLSKELCCGTHVPAAGLIEELSIVAVKGAGSHTPTIYALTGEDVLKARELFCRAQKLEQVIELVDPERRKEEVANIKSSLTELCGSKGAPYGEYAECLKLMDTFQKRELNNNDMALHTIAVTEVNDAVSEAVQSGRKFAVHFLRCSYLMQSTGVQKVLETQHALPTLVLGCAGGVIVAGATVPPDMTSEVFSAKSWLSCIVPVFQADLMPPRQDMSPTTYSEMTATKVSLINCEQLVQDAMRIAIKFAQSHIKEKSRHHPETKNVQVNP
ncbi:unnamed protein product [Arctia plantaginis]|uniref:Alanine--tRNA ligase n=1 Tax=Arctia plantaginis TaxID=874455 RepID=A0A8S1ASK8_ARCPL|nr:unnamed protein product [Arctia plantaginis]